MVKNTLEALEIGDLSFYVRHKVISPGENTQIRNQGEIQHLYMLLHAKGTKIYRLLIIGKKELPAIEEREKHWAIIDLVTKDRVKIAEILEKDVYGTVTRGERVQPEAVLVAKGEYSVKFDGRQTILSYKLKQDNLLSQLKADLNIVNHGNYILSVKNPELNPPDNPQKLPAYPSKLRKQFKDLHFIAANPIELINYVNTQVILIGAGP